MSAQSPYSHHIFLFPFRWDYKERSFRKVTRDSSLFTERTSLPDLQKLFEKHNIYQEGDGGLKPHQRWKRFTFAMNRGRDYNEYTYFDASVRNVIFDQDSSGKAGERDYILLQYDYQYEQATYRITIPDASNTETGERHYDLPVTDIVLNFYQSGVGIISIHVDNFRYESLKDVLRINENGRRIYPPFLGDHCENGTVPTDAPHQAGILAKSITLTVDDDVIQETFRYYNSGWSNVWQNPERLPKYIYALLGDRFTSYDGGAGSYKRYVQVQPIIDDRMYTMCWYGDNSFSRRMGSRSHPKSDTTGYGYETSSDWLSYIFIDTGPGGSLANRRLMAELNRKHTYDRWVEFGTLYGITRYSFVALTDRGFGATYVLQHVQTMYFQMVMLALIQRASLLRFAHEATDLASLQRGVKYRLEENAQGLYEKYLKFINKMYFRTVTAQQQGIELYHILTENIDLDKEVEVTRTEIDELNKYVSAKIESGSKRRLSLLTLLFTTFSIPSFLISYYNLDFIKQAGSTSDDSIVERFLENRHGWPFLATLVVFFGITTFYFWGDFVALWSYKADVSDTSGTNWFSRRWHRMERNGQRFTLILIILAILLTLALPVFIH